MGEAFAFVAEPEPPLGLFTVGGSSGSAEAFSAPAEGAGVAGSLKFNAPLGVFGPGDDAVGGSGVAVVFFFFTLWEAEVDDEVVVTVVVVEDALTLPLAGSWAKPEGAVGTTGVARGAGASAPSSGSCRCRSPMTLTNRMTPRAIACARLWR